MPVKGEETQGAAMVFRIRDTFNPAAHTGDQRPARASERVRSGRATRCRQRYGTDCDDRGPGQRPAHRAFVTLDVLVTAFRHPETEIGKPDAEISRRARDIQVGRGLMTISGTGPPDRHRH